MNKTVGGLNKRKLDDIELSLLCHQLAQAFKSGIHPLEAVTLITEETPSTIIRSSLKAAAESMAEGASLYEALDEAGCYPQYMLRMLDIGEKSGSLEAVLEKLSVYYENAADLKKRIRSAVLYPLILGALMLGVIALLILKIIPMFRDIIESLGGEIPTEAQALFSFIIHVKTILLVLIVVICILAAVVFMVSKTAKGKAYFDGLKINNPLTGKTYRKMITSHLSLGLGLTLKSGLPVVECLQSLKGLIPNTYVDNKLAMAGEAVLKGESLEASLKETKLFPELFTGMVRSAERTGDMDNMLERLSRIYAKETEISLKWWSGAIEPTMVVILSLIMAFILLAVLLPLIGMMSTIG